jgi:hypothetical protein
MSSVKICCMTRGDPFLEKIEGASCVWFKDLDGGWHITIQEGV